MSDCSCPGATPTERDLNGKTITLQIHLQFNSCPSEIYATTAGLVTSQLILNFSNAHNSRGHENRQHYCKQYLLRPKEIAIIMIRHLWARGWGSWFQLHTSIGIHWICYTGRVSGKAGGQKNLLCRQTPSGCGHVGLG